MSTNVELIINDNTNTRVDNSANIINEVLSDVVLTSVS